MKNKRGVCRICGCTNITPCLTPHPCMWVDKSRTLCSACKGAKSTNSPNKK